MDEYTAEVFANRDEPLPRLVVSSANELAGSSSDPDATSRRQQPKSVLSPSPIEAYPQDISAAEVAKHEASPGSASAGGRISLQDRLFSKLLQQVVPSDEMSDDESSAAAELPSSKYLSRPAFSLPLMTNNFRRFNARIGIVFVFQNRMIRLFTWRKPTHTLSLLGTYTFICLDPNLLVVVPMAIALFYIIIPAFTSRHPPPPPAEVSSSGARRDYQNHQPYTGPALAPAATIKPASETSKDFFRNMGDLQNTMADFSDAHDALVSTINPATNFSDETLSSQLFLGLTILTSLSFITAHLLPWRLIFLVLGWSAIISMHPTAQVWLLRMQKKAELQTTQALNDPTLKHQKYIHGIPLPATPHAIQSAFASLSEITLSTTPETSEVEIFELQHRPLLPVSASTGSAAEWQPHLFTPSPYDPLSPARIAGDRPRGTRFFEDVEPPEGWEWAGKKWELDLEAGEWVNDRLVVGVEYDILHHDAEDLDPSTTPASGASAPASSSKTQARNDESDGGPLRRISTSRRDSVNLDFGGWVWDLPPAPGTGVNRDDDLWLAYGDYDVPKVGVRSVSKEEERIRRKRDKERERLERASEGREGGAKKAKGSGGKAAKDWEEATRVENKGRTGEWRRRRWVRLIKRRVTT